MAMKFSGISVKSPFLNGFRPFCFLQILGLTSKKLNFITSGIKEMADGRSYEAVK
jgi:hypothetical protein